MPQSGDLKRARGAVLGLFWGKGSTMACLRVEGLWNQFTRTDAPVDVKFWKDIRVNGSGARENRTTIVFDQNVLCLSATHKLYDNGYVAVCSSFSFVNPTNSCHKNLAHQSQRHP